MDPAISHLRLSDSRLAAITEWVAPLAWESTEDMFADLACCIIEQQITYRAKGIWLNKVLDLLDGRPLRPEFVLEIQPDDWQQQKLAFPKFQSLIHLSKTWLKEKWEGLSWLEMSDEEISERLLQVKGIGPQTVHLVLLFTLHRPDIFPVGDFRLKKIMAEVYDLPIKPDPHRERLSISASWAPYRSLAVRYLWAYQQLKSSTS